MDIQVSTKITPYIEKENQKKIKLLCKIALILGIVGLIANIIIGVICFGEEEEPFWFELILMVFSMIFAIGLVVPIALNIISKKAMKTIENVVNQYAFRDDSFTVMSYRGEEKIAEAKHYYSELTKTRITEHYIYLDIGLRGSYPIEHINLTEEEKAWLLALKKKK